MKKLKYLALALAGVIFASCMGSSYADPTLDESPYGDNSIETTNLVTIAQLKAKYKNKITGNSYTTISEDMQIKGIVTGNDRGGNIYQEISIQDETGALLVCVSASGLYGYLPEGQEVIIDLKDLIIGGYGGQAEVGGIYTNTSTGAKGVGRMDRYTWEKHYKLVGEPDTTKLNTLKEDFDVSKLSDASYIFDNAGKLMTIKGVTFKDANGKNVYAPNDGSVSLTSNCANRAFTGYNSSNLCLRTSTYADFANDIIKSGTCDVTGIFTIYNSTWQILARDLNDIK